MVVLLPCHNTITAMNVARLFPEVVVRYHGLPGSIISNRDYRFMSEFWKQLLMFLDIKPRMYSPYHPQTNGQSERTNQTMKQVFRTLAAVKPGAPWIDLFGVGGDCD